MRKWEVAGGQEDWAQAANPAHGVTTLGSPSFPETLQDSLLLSCCCEACQVLVGPSLPHSSLGFPGLLGWICPYLPSSPGWRLSLSQISLSTHPFWQ